jgi:hypothetical protein
MDTSILLYQPKGIDELVLERLIKIYPNPAQESVKIKMPFEGKKQIIIVNGVGQVIEQIESNEMLQTIATKAYYNGLYFVKIITDKGIINKQFVIQQ